MDDNPRTSDKPKTLNEPNEPALFATTQVTVPVLTTAMFAFSLAVIGIASDSGWQSIPLPLMGLQTKDIAFVLLGVSALSFLSATEACIRSHAWDFYAIPTGRLKIEKISEDPSYIAHCMSQNRLWHKYAVWAYRAGFVSVLSAVVVLFWPVSPVTSGLVALYLLVQIALSFDQFLRKRAADKLREQMQS